MPNPNPHRARQAKKHLNSTKDTGTLDNARRAIWRGVERLDAAIRSHNVDVAGAADFDDAERRAALLCKLVHALSQSASVFERLVDSTEYEARLRQLEQANGIAAPWTVPTA
ncbi:hypothetical protein JYT20_01095 [Rhodothermus sp. AH-315-K08]|nr:hypothetical protein [Rhodothermus sp. AH-315-K08]